MKKIAGMKFGRRMFLIYLVGGLLPMLLISAYMIHGTNKILIEQAQNTEIVELDGIKRQILEIQNTLTTISQYFYFDEKLEEISKKKYADYQEMIDDFRGYSSFVEYGKYYNNLLSRISVFMENDTLKGNANFVVVDDKIRQQEWYQRVGTKGNSVVWEYLPHDIYGYDHALALTRMIKTHGSENVGVLVMYIRPERFEDMTLGREGTTFIVLNGETVISSRGDAIDYETIKPCITGKNTDEWQDTVEIDGQQQVVTCVSCIQKDTPDSLQVISVRSVHDIIDKATQYNVRSIFLCAMSAGLAIAIIAFSTYYFSKRIYRFRLQMQKAAEGKFDLEAKLGGNDEISELYDYLGKMIVDIQRLLADIYQQRLHAERLKTRQKDAEFKMLTSQINPHFLYNTLETIRMKAVVNKQYEIEELVSKLAKILKSAIRAGEKDVTVQTELELVECYLVIQQYRFGERIRYHIEAADDIAQCEILSLILQPIVENAIIHGLEGKEDAGYIEIDASRDGEDIVFTVEDDGIGIKEEKLLEIRKELKSNRLKGEHIGIFNVQYRIHLKYGEQYGISIDSTEGEGTRVEIRLPASKK